MADDRPADDVTSAVAKLQREFDDKLASVLARLARRPVGSLEPTVRACAPTGALLGQGQTLNRADYPDLWGWANDVGAVTGNLFGVGNGSTTFTMPDLRGRFPVGVGTLGAITYTLGSTGGSSSVTLTEAQLPAHDHTGSTGIDSNAHVHPMNHGGHFPGSQFNAAAGPDLGLAAYNSGGTTHSGTTSGPNASHTHSFTTSTAGSGTPHENRPPFVSLNWMIWT